MSSDLAISVNRATKCYHIYDRPQDRLKQSIFPRLQHALGLRSTNYFREFWALKEISLEVKKGETVGIVGKNGSGKSTLLQMICGTLTPTTGNIRTEGRVAALLELGSGFNPDFTGKENVYLNATLLGLSKDEIDNSFSQITDFADIGTFIDAFAVQSQVNPDILIVDEALAVGDAKFQAKCFERLKRLKDNGTSILLVTHSTEQIVTHCNRAILINEGTLIETGDPKKVTNRYLDLLFGKTNPKLQVTEPTKISENSGGDISSSPAIDQQFLIAAFVRELQPDQDTFNQRSNYNKHEYRWGDGKARLFDFLLACEDSAYPSSIETGKTVSLMLAVHYSEEFKHPIVGITIKTKEGVTVSGTNSELSTSEFEENHAQLGKTAVYHIRFKCHLAAGDYFISTGIASRDNNNVVPHDRRYDAIHFQVSSDHSHYGLVDLGIEICTMEPQ
jgi:lipopolysaccharide transport system ATP-binding protein